MLGQSQLREKICELSKEMQAMRQSLDHLKTTFFQAENKQAKKK